MLNLHGYFKAIDWDEELIIVRESNGGNACNGVYRIIALKKGGSFKVFQEMGNCTPPTVIWEPTKITIRFPYLNKKAVSQTWVYQNGILKQIPEKIRRQHLKRNSLVGLSK